LIFTVIVFTNCLKRRKVDGSMVWQCRVATKRCRCLCSRPRSYEEHLKRQLDLVRAMNAHSRNGSNLPSNMQTPAAPTQYNQVADESSMLQKSLKLEATNDLPPQNFATQATIPGMITISTETNIYNPSRNLEK
jgi:hypothetical protein